MGSQSHYSPQKDLVDPDSQAHPQGDNTHQYKRQPDIPIWGGLVQPEGRERDHCECDGLEREPVSISKREIIVHGDVTQRASRVSRLIRPIRGKT